MTPHCWAALVLSLTAVGIAIAAFSLAALGAVP